MSDAPNWIELTARIDEFFTPSAPIDAVDLFAGRWDQLMSIKDAVVTKGQHAIVFGERGVGKTSLVSVVGALMRAHKLAVPLVVRENCGEEDTFAKLWKRALAQVVTAVDLKKAIGFDATTSKEVRTLAQRVSAEPTADEVVTLLRNIPPRIVFVFDEFDQLPQGASSKPFADTIKALSDYAVPSTVILVGVGANVMSLLESHASVERALLQVHVPRMRSDELEEILSKVALQIGIDFAPDATQQIVDFSQGLPHYTHLLGKYAGRSAVRRHSTLVEPDDVDTGVGVAVSKVSKSILDGYKTAIDSPQRDALFKHVLLACSLTIPDDRGTFTAGDVRPALRAIGRELEIPAFAPHLNKFASADRGTILEKTGQERRFRYRFRNPLMQPYVVMRGLADGLCTFDQIRDLRSTPTPQSG